MAIFDKFDKSRDIFVDYGLAHEMDSRELTKAGMSDQDIERIESNVILDKCGSCIIAVIKLKPGTSITSFEQIDPDNKTKSSYFAFLGIVGSWVDKVNCE